MARRCDFGFKGTERRLPFLCQSLTEHSATTARSVAVRAVFIAEDGRCLLVEALLLENTDPNSKGKVLRGHFKGDSFPVVVPNRHHAP